MNTAANDDPMGPEYWANFERRDKQTVAERNRRNGRYGGCDPATGGWSRPSPSEPPGEAAPQE